MKMSEKESSKTWNLKVLDNKTRVRSLLGNRDINKSHVNSLKESMKEHGVLSAVTVMKTGKSYTLLDGHHRWQAAKSLGYSVPAIVVGKDSSVAVVAMNNVQKNWTLRDYTKYYSTSGDRETREAYQELISYHNETGLNYSCLTWVLGRQPVKKFKEGNFRPTKLVFAKAFFAYLKDIEEYVPFTTHSKFVMGFVDIASNPKYNHKRMMSKLKQKHNIVIEAKSTPNTFGKLMNELYNYKVHKDNLVMFKNWR